MTGRRFVQQSLVFAIEAAELMKSLFQVLPNRSFIGR
jgi:hypothetical protein